MRLFLSGDVMVGRGIDQIGQHPSSPGIHEDYLKDARDYVRLAERVHGPIPTRVSPEYIWGDALFALEEASPDARIINLETSITVSKDWVDKGINYRAHPANVGYLTVARVDASRSPTITSSTMGARGSARPSRCWMRRGSPAREPGSIANKLELLRASSCPLRVYASTQ